MIATADAEKFEDGYSTPADIAELEMMAKREILESKVPAPRGRAFLAYRAQDRERINTFIEKAKKLNPNLDFIDFSLKVHFKNENANYVRSCISMRIKNSSNFLVFIGDTTHDCEWIIWEIGEGLRLGKDVIAIKLRDDSRLKIPKIIKERKIRPVSLEDKDISRIVHEINKKSSQIFYNNSLKDNGMARREKVLFISMHSSARSQMAVGLLRSLYGDRYKAFSAGIDPKNLDPRAVLVMAERGIDISKQESRHLKEYWGQEFDTVVKVRDLEKEPCVLFPSGKRATHKGLLNPANVEGTEEEKTDAFRKARDELERWIVETFG